MKNNTDIRFKSFIAKIAEKGKTGIRLPLKERDANQYIENLKNLLEKGLISDTVYNEGVKETNSRSLDEEMYREFYELLKQ